MRPTHSPSSTRWFRAALNSAPTRAAWYSLISPISWRKSRRVGASTANGRSGTWTATPSLSISSSHSSCPTRSRKSRDKSQAKTCCTRPDRAASVSASKPSRSARNSARPLRSRSSYQAPIACPTPAAACCKFRPAQVGELLDEGQPGRWLLALRREGKDGDSDIARDPVELRDFFGVRDPAEVRDPVTSRIIPFGVNDWRGGRPRGTSGLLRGLVLRE